MAAPVPGLFTSTIAAMVIPRKTSRERSRSPPWAAVRYLSASDSKTTVVVATIPRLPDQVQSLGKVAFVLGSVVEEPDVLELLIRVMIRRRDVVFHLRPVQHAA